MNNARVLFWFDYTSLEIVLLQYFTQCTHKCIQTTFVYKIHKKDIFEVYRWYSSKAEYAFARTAWREGFILCWDIVCWLFFFGCAVPYSNMPEANPAAHTDMCGGSGVSRLLLVWNEHSFDHFLFTWERGAPWHIGKSIIDRPTGDLCLSIQPFNYPYFKLLFMWYVFMCNEEQCIPIRFYWVTNCVLLRMCLKDANQPCPINVRRRPSLFPSG